MKSDETHKNKTGFQNTANRCQWTKKSQSENEEKYRNIIENIEEGYFEVDLAGNFTYFNDTMCRVLGYPREELMGMNYRQYTDKEELKKVFQAYHKVYKTGKTNREFSQQIIRKDGTKRYFEGYTSLQKDSSGEPRGFRGILHDVTERKHTERVLRENEERLRGITQNLPGIIFQFFAKDSGEYGVSYISEPLAEFSEIVANIDKTNLDTLFPLLLSRIHEEDRDRFLTSIKEAVETETSWNFAGRITIQSDKIIWIHGLSTPTRNEGQLVFNGILLNITEQKQAEELLKQSEYQYRLLADHVKDSVWLMDLNLQWTYISPSGEKILGYTLKELKQLPLDKFLSPTSFQMVMDLFSNKIRTVTIEPSLVTLLELECQCKDGRTLWIEATLSFIRDENGKPVSILGEGRDITERKQVEYDLRASEENFRHSLNDSPLGVRISTIEGETIYANRAILDIYGYDSIEELIKTPLKERYTPESYSEFQLRKKKRLRGEFGPSEYKISIVRKNGEIRHLNVFRKEIFWNGQRQSQVVYQDITEHRQAEEKLRETLESLRKSVKTTIQVLGTASEARDPYTAGHQKKVANLARVIATEMVLPQDTIEGIRIAGSIHDIGKLSIPSEILSKPTKLTSLESSLIKEHSRIGYEMLKDVESPWPLAEIVYQHHEWMNGSGYPRNLKGNEILMESRILTVADVVEAMASHRPYRPTLGIEAALEEIEKNKGILYDDAVVDACLRLFREKEYQLS